MARHAELRAHPERLHPGTLTVISAAARLSAGGRFRALTLNARPSRATHRDATTTGSCATACRSWPSGSPTLIGPFGYRVFSDSAPVMEVDFAQQAGLGWRGKHTLLLSREGSWRFLGEIYCDLPLPPDAPAADHCGTCTACLDACPTRAIVAPYRVDARRCISYLTIELAGAIPEELRPLIGNRIYGCDDCQSCCPWNRFARIGDPAFARAQRPRHGDADRPVRLERGGVRHPPRRQPDPPHRPRALAAQYRRRPRQWPGHGRRSERTEIPRRRPLAAGARACRVGAGEARARCRRAVTHCGSPPGGGSTW